MNEPLPRLALSLPWHTDRASARRAAAASGKPILSLRLLGRLDEALSCANSRFFRAHLYPDPTIHALLAERFVLHWESLRPVPLITLDFGGRTITKPITGNSLHLVLDADGRPRDVLPGLFDRITFARLLREALALAEAPLAEVAERHRARLREPEPPPAPPEPPSPAERASRLAPTKHMVEAPLLAHLRRVGDSVAADTAQNLEFRRAISELFAAGAPLDDEELVAWVYSALFRMPLEDPNLGLDVPDPL
jgi:hypothetical protein